MFTPKLINNFKRVIPVLNVNHVREMSRVKQRFTMPPFWQPKKTRVAYPEALTTENQEFVKEHIKTRYSSPLKEELFEKVEWEPNSYRCGLISKKIGVLPFWLKSGKRVASTLLHVTDNHVIKYIPPEDLEKNDFKLKRRVQRKDRPLGALIVGTGAASPTQFTKEYFNLFQEAGVLPKRRLTKFLITPNAKLPPGFPLYAAHFRPGDVVDCAGITADRGFQGVMKRWQFKGGPATHGNTKSHRRPGNIGGGGGAKARVWPGTKMPGHMGRHRRTLVGQKVLRVNTKYNVIWVMGRAVPGEIGNYVIIYDTMLPLRRKSKEEAARLFPTYFPDEEELPEDLFDESIHDFRLPSITFAEDEK